MRHDVCRDHARAVVAPAAAVRGHYGRNDWGNVALLDVEGKQPAVTAAGRAAAQRSFGVQAAEGRRQAHQRVSVLSAALLNCGAAAHAAAACALAAC